MLLYRLEFAPQKLIIRIEESGSRRILYLDTLKILAKEDDKPALAFLTKIHLRSPNISRSLDTVSFQIIEVSLEQSLEALKLLSKTGRLYFKNICLQSSWEKIAKIYWKGDERGSFSAVLQWNSQEISLEQCEHLSLQWGLIQGTLFPLATDVPWKWVELFLKGPIVLQGAQKKKFLDEEPPIVWKEKTITKPLEVFPELVLSDATGCFANLWMEYSGLGRIAFDDLSPAILGRARLKKEEESWEKDLLESGFSRKIVGASRYYCPGDKTQETLHFLLDLGWKIFGLSGKRILRQTSASWDVREENGKIAIRGKVHFGTLEASLKSSMQSRSLWVELEGNNVGLLDRKKWASLEGEWEEDVLVIKKSGLKALSSVFQGDQVRWESRLCQMVEGLQEGAILEEVLPGSSFQGTLLPYQQKGLDWLFFLQKWGFSGLLADEMGLGKTVQVLAFFSLLRTNLPILVVAPSSLLYQWKQEIHRFLPNTPVYIHAGPDRNLTNLSQGICITSYAVLRLDEERLSKIEFEVIVLDESNAIKTSTTLTAQVSYRLQGKFRIALTGTPIENRTEELLSQFKFLMPDFHVPHLDSLKKQIRPFIMRRKKEDVAMELPEKMEQITWVEMNEEQEALYQDYMSRAKGGLLKKIEEEGIAKHRMEALETILRLRQICLDPRLVGGNTIGAKLDLLLDDVEDRKVLIYSQFTSMLQLIGKELMQRGKDFLYLDGSVSAQNRAHLVQQFQEDPKASIFLLSLKAGGVGLNLTAAEYVILFDPWWNEAVEQQAIDRAHRLGQKKTVIAKRYLIPNSIEEKMLRLKEKKRGIAELLLEGEEFNWTEEDLLHLLT